MGDSLGATLRISETTSEALTGAAVTAGVGVVASTAVKGVVVATKTANKFDDAASVANKADKFDNAAGAGNVAKTAGKTDSVASFDNIAKTAMTGDVARMGGSVGTATDVNTVRVGRWMSQAEYEKMIRTGKVQMSSDNKAYVANPANIDAFGAQALPGSIYVEFDVTGGVITQGGVAGWGIINGPGSLIDRLNAKKGLPRILDMPDATNIQIKGNK